MTLARVDPRGFLPEFHGVPPRYSGPPTAGGGTAAAPVVDWQVVFDVVALVRDRSRRRSAVDRPRPRPTHERRGPDHSRAGGSRLRLEAGAFADASPTCRPSAWTKPSREALPAPTLTQRLLEHGAAAADRLVDRRSALLARRNLRAGRGDRARLARRPRVGTLMMLRWLASAHAFRDLRRLPGALIDAFADALLNAGLAWLAYLGIEPWLRRTGRRACCRGSGCSAGSFRDRSRPRRPARRRLGVAAGL